MLRHEGGYRDSMLAAVAVVGVGGIAAFGIFDGLRSIGQNVEAESLLDHARAVVTGDFNPWEQTKDYIAPQDAPEAPDLTRNEDKAGLFDGSRDWDMGHIVIGGVTIVVGAALTPSKKNR